MGKTKDRAAQAAAAGQTRAAPGSPEAARAAAHLTPLLRRNEQATVLAAALTALGQLFANGTLNETDFAALEARLAPCLFDTRPRVTAALTQAAAHLPPRPHIERHLLATLAQDKRANAARALISPAPPLPRRPRPHRRPAHPPRTRTAPQPPRPPNPRLPAHPYKRPPNPAINKTRAP
ncbi:hypothetical protein [Neisseria bacilliformis]|uniref:hypothetical protein n=1 Tax=Neisseria bacilliformis TaxID=267212 RepID=UPI0002E52481|nr:hypothetical protein [Neisseria bacilliformis]